MRTQTNGDPTWKKRVDGLLARTLELFVPDGVASEVSCEGGRGYTCTTDLKQFKGMLHRGLGQTARAAPYAKDQILPVLRTSAAAAVRTCAEGANRRLCSTLWTGGGQGDQAHDMARKDGAAAQMDVLNALNSVLMASADSNTKLAGGNGTSDGGKGQGGSDAAGGGKDGNKDTPGSMGSSSAVSTVALLGGLFFSAMAIF